MYAGSIGEGHVHLQKNEFLRGGPNAKYASVEKFRVITDAPKCVSSEEHLMAEIHYKIFTNVRNE
jgi:hypothetical protein